MADSHSIPRPSALGDPMEAWKARGRELNAIYDVLRPAMHDESTGDAVADIKALVAERDELRVRMERLRDVAGLLGLLPSGRDTDGRVIFLAYLIATGSEEEHIAEARAEVEVLKPGWLKRAASLREKVVAGA